MREYSKIRQFLYLFFAITLSGVQYAKAESQDFTNIVLLNSYHPTFKWTADITKGVLKEFKDDKQTRIFVVYMDAKSFKTEK